MTVEERLDLFLSKSPTIHPSAYVAPNAIVVGDVKIGEESSIWYHCVMRGDINRIVVGPRSNIQDGTVIHVADDYAATIGEYVTVGHKAIIHACTIDNEVLVGMGAIILDGAKIGARSIIGANTLVTMHSVIPPGSLVLGSPARVVKTLDIETQQTVRKWADKYVINSRRYKERGL
jgi:carbonic anhydrase/acetyltransferase-like protein (isoleucine patch superfamily)